MQILIDFKITVIRLNKFLYLSTKILTTLEYQTQNLNIIILNSIKLSLLKKLKISKKNQKFEKKIKNLKKKNSKI